MLSAPLFLHAAVTLRGCPTLQVYDSLKTLLATGFKTRPDHFDKPLISRIGNATDTAWTDHWRLPLWICAVRALNSFLGIDTWILAEIKIWGFGQMAPQASSLSLVTLEI